MADTLIVSPNRDHIELSSHGSAIPLLWRCFARRGMVFSEIEGFEAARIQPGGYIPEHTHARTEEIYFVTRGTATMTLDDERVDVGPGDVIMLPLNGRHSIRNTGEDELEIVVIEFAPPEVTDRLPPRAPSLQA